MNLILNFLKVQDIQIPILIFNNGVAAPLRFRDSDTSTYLSGFNCRTLYE